MKHRALLGIIALVPAALNIAPAAHGMTVALCTGDGAARTITLPPAGNGPGDGTLPGKEQPGCCAKACHTGSRKKSQNRQIDT